MYLSLPLHVSVSLISSVPRRLWLVNLPSSPQQHMCPMAAYSSGHIVQGFHTVNTQ